MKFTIYQESRIGRRKINEDRIAYSYSREALIMVVADGMGGHLNGEIAAQIAVQYIIEAFQREAKPGIASPINFLSSVLTHAHHAISDYAERRNLPETPRTTCLVCLIQDGRALWAHAGDSRLYLMRDGRVTDQTRDHSKAQSLLDQGMLSTEEAHEHPARNRLYSCLGGLHSPQIDFSLERRLRAGDILFLCSDGVWSPLGEAGIVSGVRSGDIVAALPGMLDEAEARSGPQCDNLSVICLRWDDQSAAPPASGSISTLELDPGFLNTQLEGFAEGDTFSGAGELSDDEIERAVREIREAIKKFSKT